MANHSQAIRISFLLTTTIDIIACESVIEKMSSDSRFSVALYYRTFDKEADKGILDYCASRNWNPLPFDIRNYCSRPEDILVISRWYFFQFAFFQKLDACGIKLVIIPYACDFTMHEKYYETMYRCYAHSAAWKIYTIHEDLRKMYEIHGATKEKNAINIKTTPKFDYVRKHCMSPLRPKARRFLWCLHLDMINDSQNELVFSGFFPYYNTILETFKNNPELSLTLRLHPTIVSVNSKKPTFARLRRLLKCDNIHVEMGIDGPYMHSFTEADAFICDLSTTCYDMFITGKPIISLFHQRSMPLLPFGVMFFQKYTYIADSNEKLHAAIESLASGQDPQRPFREYSLKNDTLFTATPACEIITQDIASDFQPKQPRRE